MELVKCRRNVCFFRTSLICVVAVVVLMMGYHYSFTTHYVQSQDLAVDSENNAFEVFLRENLVLTNYSGQGTKYIVYDCSKARKVQCSGWSDRMVGIVTTFIISILAKQHFLINFDTPCFLQDYLIPAHFDWRYNSSILLDRTSSFHNLKSKNYTKINKYLFRGHDFNTYFNYDVNFLLMNRDFISGFRQRPNIVYDIPWITKYHQADIYKHVYNFLFKLSPVSVQALNHLDRTQRKRNKIACAHVRVGRNPNMPDDAEWREPPLYVLWKYFDTLNKNEYDLFVASDTDNVNAFAKERYPGNMIDTPGKITHIDRPYMNDPREGFLKQLLDFYVLVRCDILIISGQSGFGILAAFVRNIASGLYCWREQDLIPCSRYTIPDIFPGGKYGNHDGNERKKYNHNSIGGRGW